MVSSGLLMDVRDELYRQALLLSQMPSASGQPCSDFSRIAGGGVASQQDIARGLLVSRAEHIEKNGMRLDRDTFYALLEQDEPLAVRAWARDQLEDQLVTGIDEDAGLVMAGKIGPHDADGELLRVVSDDVIEKGKDMALDLVRGIFKTLRAGCTDAPVPESGKAPALDFSRMMVGLVSGLEAATSRFLDYAYQEPKTPQDVFDQSLAAVFQVHAAESRELLRKIVIDQKSIATAGYILTGIGFPRLEAGVPGMEKKGGHMLVPESAVACQLSEMGKVFMTLSLHTRPDGELFNRASDLFLEKHQEIFGTEVPDDCPVDTSAAVRRLDPYIQKVQGIILSGIRQADGMDEGICRGVKPIPPIMLASTNLLQ